MSQQLRSYSLQRPATRLLVFAEEQERGQEVAAILRQLGFAADEVSTTVADAVERLEAEGLELVLIEARRGRIAALELAALIRDLGLETRMALLVDDDLTELRGRLPIVPRSELESEEGRQRAAETVEQAAVTPPPRLYPQDFLFVTAVARCSASLRFVGLGKQVGEAEIEVVEGTAWNVYCGDFLGEAGLERMMRHPVETVLVRPLTREPEHRQIPQGSAALSAAYAAPPAAGPRAVRNTAAPPDRAGRAAEQELEADPAAPVLALAEDLEPDEVAPVATEAVPSAETEDRDAAGPPRSTSGITPSPAAVAPTKAATSPSGAGSPGAGAAPAGPPAESVTGVPEPVAAGSPAEPAAGSTLRGSAGDRPRLRLAPSPDAQDPAGRPPAAATAPPRRAAVDALCQRLVQESSGGRACSVIALPDGHLLGAAGFGSESLLEAMRQAALHLLGSADLSRLDQLLGGTGGDEPLLHAFLASGRFSFLVEALPNRRAAVLLVTDPTNKSGLARADVRRALPELLAALG